MIATMALLVDGYRELSSRKLFWLTMAISLVVVGVFACLGINDRGFTILHWTIETPGFTTAVFSKSQFYKMLFAAVGVPIWLAWGSTILALVSTGSIFPDLIAGGSIELVLSKPISRLRLFLTKYATGLVFTGLQTVVFSVGCFFVFGARAGVWAPGVLWAVPFLVLFYSYLFAISTLVGMITRSAMTAIITTMLIWFLVFLLNSADAVVLQFKVINELQQETQVSRIERLERTARAGWAKDREEKGLAVQEPTGVEIDALNPKIPELRKDLDESRANGKTLGMVNTGLVIAKTVCPKTGETMEMLKRRFGDLLPEALDEGESETFKGPGDLSPKQRREVQRRVDAALSARGPAWILGTSLGFEVVVLGIAGWLFCRRDF